MQYSGVFKRTKVYVALFLGGNVIGVKRDISDMDDPEEDSSPTKKVNSILK